MEYLDEDDKSLAEYRIKRLEESLNEARAQTLDEVHTAGEKYIRLSKEYHKLVMAFRDLEDAYYSHKHLDQSLGTIKSMLSIGTTLLKIL